VTSAGCLDGRVFRGWFKRISRQLGIPMCPHNFRHALASLLIKAHPGQYEGVAVLLGDTEGTVRCYYAWVNRQVQVEAAQALVMDLANVA
jgi:integrase